MRRYYQKLHENGVTKVCLDFLQKRGSFLLDHKIGVHDQVTVILGEWSDVS